MSAAHFLVEKRSGGFTVEKRDSLGSMCQHFCNRALKGLCFVSRDIHAADRGAFQLDDWESGILCVVTNSIRNP